MQIRSESSKKILSQYFYKFEYLAATKSTVQNEEIMTAHPIPNTIIFLKNSGVRAEHSLALYIKKWNYNVKKSEIKYNQKYISLEILKKPKIRFELHINRNIHSPLIKISLKVTILAYFDHSSRPTRRNQSSGILFTISIVNQYILEKEKKKKKPKKNP